MTFSTDSAIQEAIRLAELGELEKAAALYNTVLEKFPNDGRAKQGLEKIQKQHSSHAVLASDMPDTQINPLIDQLNDGRFEFVIEEATRQLPQYRNDFLLHHVLACAYAGMNRHEGAISSYQAAIKLNPSFAAAHNGLGMALSAAGRFHEATESYKRGIEQAPNSAEIYNNLGNVLTDQYRHVEAIENLKRAVAIKPDFAVAYKNLGAVYNEIGAAADAIACYESAIALRPGYADAHYGLSQLKRYEKNDPHITQMSRLATHSQMSDQDHATIAFALGKAMEDIDEKREAFKFYSNGNRLRKSLIQYDISKDRDRFNIIQEIFLSSNIAPAEWLPSQTPLRPTPIFVVGMPRSGTTLVEQILSSHADVHGGGELTLINEAMNSFAWRNCCQDPAVLENINSLYYAGLEKIGVDALYVTDKMPLNFLWLGFILTAIPHARVVHVKRDARATCWSIFKQNFGRDGNGFAYDLNDITEFYRLYLEYMHFWDKTFPGRVYHLSYERLTENQKTETRKLLENAGLKWQDSCLEFYKNDRPVMTASANQIRQQIYAGSSKAWRKYEGFLGSMVDCLKDC